MIDEYIVVMSDTSEEDREKIKNFPYRSLLGALQYFRLTRPDVLQAISECSKFQNDPGIKHINAALRIFSPPVVAGFEYVCACVLHTTFPCCFEGAGGADRKTHQSAQIVTW